MKTFSTQILFSRLLNNKKMGMTCSLGTFEKKVLKRKVLLSKFTFHWFLSWAYCCWNHTHIYIPYVLSWVHMKEWLLHSHIAASIVVEKILKHFSLNYYAIFFYHLKKQLYCLYHTILQFLPHQKTLFLLKYYYFFFLYYFFS